MRLMTRPLLSVLLGALVVLTGCARNAVLEGELLLPPNPPGESLFACVQVFEEGTVFEVDWAGNSLRSQALTSDVQQYAFSVNSELGDFDDDLLIKVRFGTDDKCQNVGAMDPQSNVWIVVGSPLYLGEVTRFRLDIPGVPHVDTAPGGVCQLVDGTNPSSLPVACRTSRDPDRPTWCCNIDRCEVEGCIEGTLSTFCNAEGVHECER